MDGKSPKMRSIGKKGPGMAMELSFNNILLKFLHTDYIAIAFYNRVDLIFPTSEVCGTFKFYFTIYSLMHKAMEIHAMLCFLEFLLLYSGGISLFFQ